MNQKLNLEELNTIINKLQGYKPIKIIKVTTAFAKYIDQNTHPLPHYESNKFYDGMWAEYQGTPIEIDDTIEGHYKLIY